LKSFNSFQSTYISEETLKNIVDVNQRIQKYQMQDHSKEDKLENPVRSGISDARITLPIMVAAARSRLADL